MAKYAVIDVGTNAIKFLIAEKDAESLWSVAWDRAEITRLGAGLHATGAISPEALERNVNAMTRMIAMAHAQGVEQVIAVGTLCLRVAKNAPEFRQRVKQACGVTIEVLSGGEEARLAYLSVKTGLSLTYAPAVIFDAGGGSTEFIWGQAQQIERRMSVNVGAVRYTEQILISDPVTQPECDQARSAIEHDLAEVDCAGPVTTLIGVGGGITNLCAVQQQLTVYQPDRIHGTTLELAEVERQIALYQSKTIAERKKIVGLQPARADVILAGAMIVSAILKKFGCSALTVSDHGLRHGILADRFHDDRGYLNS